MTNSNLATRWLGNSVQRRTLLTGAVVATLALGLNACSGSAASAPTEETITEKIKISQATPLDFGPVWVAVEEGFFKDEGLDVELAKPIGTGAESIAMINSGQVDLIAGSPSAMLSAASQGLKTVSVVGLSAFPSSEDEDPAALLVDEDSDIQSLSDLSGKTIGVTSIKSQQESKVAMSIDAAGGDASTVEFIQVPPASMPGLIKSGEIDAAQPFEPGVTKALNEGGVRAVGYANWQVLGDAPAMVLATTPEWKEQNAAKAKKVAKAIARAVSFINDEANADRFHEIAGKYTETDPEILSRARMDTFTSEVSADGFQKLQQHLLDYGILSSEVDVTELIGD